MESAMQPLTEGSLINDRFRVLSLLGSGGQGAVYRAADSRCNDREVALKVIRFNPERTESLKRATAEYAVLSKLFHPNIVRVLDAGRLPDNGCFIAMEYIAGTTLAARIVELGRVPFPDTLQILREVALGLEAAHQADVIHRDLKPGNVMLADDGRVLLLDFGLARDMKQGVTLTETGFTAGTWTYMSPEQINRLTKLDERTDVYAFGVVAFEMVTGKPPFGGETDLQIARMHLGAPPPRISPKEFDVPEWFGNLVGVCLQKKAADRFQSMTEIRTRLEKRMRMGFLDGPVERTNPFAQFFLRLIGEH